MVVMMIIMTIDNYRNNYNKNDDYNNNDNLYDNDKIFIEIKLYNKTNIYTNTNNTDILFTKISTITSDSYRY